MVTQLQPGNAAQRATLLSADYGLVELSEHDTTAAWVMDPANASALEVPEMWRALYEFRCCKTPVVSLLPNGIVHAGPALLAPIVACQPQTLVVAGLPPGDSASAVVMPGTSSTLGRLGGGLGLYLATTGHALPAAEALQAGLVTHVLDNHASRSLMLNTLSVLSEGGRFDHAVEVIDELSVLDPASMLYADADDNDDEDGFAPLGKLVEETFGATATREELLQSLQQMRDRDGPGALWAQACLDSLNRLPAWQVRLTLALVNAASDADEATCLALEHYIVSFIADRRRAEEDLDGAVTPLAAAAVHEDLVQLARSGTGGDIAASWGGSKPQFPFGPDQLQYLDHVRRTYEADLSSSPGKQRRAEDALAQLNTMRGSLAAVRWMNVQSQLLDYAEQLVDEARRAGLETGPMGVKFDEMLREEDGRRTLQPILTVAAERGVLFVEDIDSESMVSEEINDAYRLNYEYASSFCSHLNCIDPPTV
jgi:enoyl-CoA hydratase/carnithine racemase